MTLGRNQEHGHSTDNGEAQQTLKERSTTSTSTTLTMKMTLNKHNAPKG